MARNNLQLPRDASDVTARWMQLALAADGNPDVPPVEHLSIEEIGAGFGMVGIILRCHLHYQDGEPGGPTTVIAKLPSTHEATLQTAKRLRLYQREYAFYRRLARHSPLRSPALLYGDFDDDSHRFVLLLEDLRHMTSVDQVDGASRDQAKIAVRAVARLHAKFWDQLDQPPLSEFYDPANPERHSLAQSVYQASLPAAMDRFGHLFSDSMRQLATSYGSLLNEHMAVLASEPQTFTHGDFRLDNMFYGGGGPEDFAAVDWQVSGVASGLSDVAYFLSSSVSSEVRRDIERDALAEYHAVIAGAGIDDFTLEDCWRSYRRNMLGCFRTPIIAGGQLDFTSERSRRLAEVFLQRTLTAIDELDAGEFLPGATAGR